MPKLNNKCYSLEKNGTNADITMYGEVVDSQPYDFWTGKPVEGSFIIKDEFLADLEELAECEEITIHMDSVGGDTAVGLLIHNKLRDLSQAGKKLNCIVDGVAMSAGSLIMSACDNVTVHPTSLIMVHNAWVSMCGGYNADELRAQATALNSWDKALRNAYVRKTGLSEAVVGHMMSKTTYMTGDEAVEKKFADNLDKSDGAAIAASEDRSALVVNGRYISLKGAPAPEGIPTVSASQNCEDDTNNKPKESGDNGGNIMASNLAELKAENPALAAQIEQDFNAKNESKIKAAAEDERKRMEEIDAIASIYDPALVKAAKYDKPCSAQELAYQAALAAAKQGQKFTKDLKTDSKEANAVPEAAAPDDPKEAEKNPQAMQREADAMIHELLHGKEAK